jgi:hypothetical protein
MTEGITAEQLLAADGRSSRDVELVARGISAAARDLGVAADPGAL